MILKFLHPYEQIGFNIGLADPEYHIGIGSLGTPNPRLFSIVALSVHPVTSMRTEHTLSRDYFTLQEAAEEWQNGFEVNGHGDRTEVTRIIDHLVKTQQAQIIG